MYCKNLKKKQNISATISNDVPLKTPKEHRRGVNYHMGKGALTFSAEAFSGISPAGAQKQDHMDDNLAALV